MAIIIIIIHFTIIISLLILNQQRIL